MTLQENAIAANERVGLIEHGLFEHAKVRRRLRRGSKHSRNPSAILQVPGSAMKAAIRGFSVAAGGAW